MLRGMDGWLDGGREAGGQVDRPINQTDDCSHSQWERERGSVAALMYERKKEQRQKGMGGAIYSKM